jgi:hypothetical protein
MAHFDLTVSPSYVENWGVWEALREILQNALDEQDNNHPMSLNWTPGRGGTLVIRNDGSVIERKHLILGESGKRDDDRMRGKFGEGFKLALLVLARLGVDVRLRTGGETWHPEIVESEQYGTKLLRIRTTKRIFERSVEYCISPVEKESFELLKQRILPLRSDFEKVETGGGDLLLGTELKGSVFLKGIFVSKVPNAKYGYNFKELELDRDRKMADVWSLESQMRLIFSEAVRSGKMGGTELMSLADDSSSAEGRAMTYGLPYGTEVVVKEAFEAKHGPDAVAVTSITEAAEASKLGLKAVVVSSGLHRALKNDKVDEARKSIGKSASRKYQWHELSTSDQEMLTRAIELVGEDLTVDMHVVDFNDENVLGRYSSKESKFELALKVINMGLGEVIHTICHELAHAKSMEHDVVHGAETGRLMGRVIDRLTK